MPLRTSLRSSLIRAAALLHRPRVGSRVAPSSILLIRPDHLGDMLFLTPALHALRRAQPEAEITLLVGPWSQGVLAGNPDVDRVETLAFPGFERQPKGSLLAPYRDLYRAAARLRGRFDIALICRFDHWWGAWLAAAAGIPRIAGYDTPDVRPFLTDAAPYRAGRHEVIQNFGLTHLLGTRPAAAPRDHPLRYFAGAAQRDAARALLQGVGLHVGEGPLIAIHPGSGALVKRWEVARWGALMHALHGSHGARFLITGGPDETALAEAVEGAAGGSARSVAGQTTLPQLAALFEQCDLVLGPDSGPLHLAVAVGRPTVHLYGPVPPATFGPWGDPAYNVVVHRSLACQFCQRLDWSLEELPEHPCVSSIPVEWVLAAATALLERKTRNEL